MDPLQLWSIHNDYETRYEPRLVVYTVEREGPKCYTVKTSKWHSRGKLILKDRVDGEYSHYFTTPRKAWEAYAERCKQRISESERMREEATKNLHHAQAALAEL